MSFCSAHLTHSVQPSADQPVHQTFPEGETPEFLIFEVPRHVPSKALELSTSCKFRRVPHKEKKRYFTGYIDIFSAEDLIFHVLVGIS